VHSPLPPRVPAPVQYVSTHQMLYPLQVSPPQVSPPQVRIPPQNQINPSTILLHPPPPTIISPPPPYPTRTPPPPSYEQIIRQNEQNNNRLNNEQVQYGQSHQYRNQAMNPNRENMFQSHARDPSGDEQGIMTQNHIRDPRREGQGINYN